MTKTPAAYEHPRENTEWTVTYCYNATGQRLPRVLLVGDSICNGYQAAVRDELAGSVDLAFYATSKCVTDRSYLTELAFILGEYDYAAIHFNNGLHSLNTPPKEWEQALRAAFALIQAVKPAARIAWCSSTPLADVALTAKARALNVIGAKVAAEFALPINDLFALMDPLDRTQHWADPYHFNETARTLQARQVAAAVRALLGVSARPQAKA